MKGWSNASSNEPGDLRENMALFNKTIPGLVPNMLLELSNVTLASYACIGTPLNLFGFSLLSRPPLGYNVSRVRNLVDELNARASNKLDVEKLRIADELAFRNCGLL